MQKSPDNLDSLKLHAGHVLNALDPSIEMKGPGSGYGVKRAAAGASQHVQLAAKSEGVRSRPVLPSGTAANDDDNPGRFRPDAERIVPGVPASDR